MISRRGILVGGGGGLAALGVGPIARAAAVTKPTAASPVLLLVDSTLDGADGAADVAKRLDIPFATFAGDFGTVWLERLEPLWRHGPRAIAGITYAGAFFCAEQLARRHGMACTFRRSPPEPGAVAPLVELAMASFEWPSEQGVAERGNRPLVWALAPRRGAKKQ